MEQIRESRNRPTQKYQPGLDKTLLQFSVKDYLSISGSGSIGKEINLNPYVISYIKI